MNENTIEDIAMHMGKISRSLELIARSMNRWDDGGIADPGGYVAQLATHETERAKRETAHAQSAAPVGYGPLMSTEEAVRAAESARDAAQHAAALAHRAMFGGGQK